MSEEIQLTKEDRYDLELIRGAKRSSQGLSLTEQDFMAFLVDAKNHRERTRIPETGVFTYSGWEFLAEMYPKTFGFLTGLAKTECIYYISLDGLQRQEAILMTKAKTAPAMSPLTIENIQGQPPLGTSQQPQQQQEQKPKGKHFWNR